MDNDEWDGMGDDDDEDEDNMDDADSDDDDDDDADDVDDDVDLQEILGKAQLEFQDECEAARRNDPKKTTVYASIVKGYGIPLGNALVGNTYVENLHLRLLAENVNSPDDENWGVHNIALLLQYLREGEAFRRLHTHGGSLEYTSACVRAIAQNPNTKSLTMDDGTEIPLLETIDLLRTHETLQFLFMPMMNSTELAEAMQANQSLDALVLTFDPDAWPKPNGVMLHHLHSHSKLRRLSIIRKHDCSSLDAEVDLALYSLLSHRSTKLKTLQLFCFTFDRSQIELFTEALHASQSLERLELYKCEFKAEAVAFLDSAVLSPTKCQALSASPVCQLFVQENADGLLVALLALVFSNLQSLEWQWGDRGMNVNAFWNRLQEADTSRIHLQTLRLEYWPTQKCQAMNSCIPKLVTLRELHFLAHTSYDWDPSQFLETKRSFVKAVRQSPSLIVVSVEFYGIGELESTILSASLQRNGRLPLLLSRPRLDHLKQGDEAGTDLYIYPSLCSVSQQSPYGALNAILTGLLALSENIGPK
jgi:hypothetical protein